MTNSPDFSQQFTRERQRYHEVRPKREDHECVFVPCQEGLGGYVTFDEDAQRLEPAIKQARIPEYEAKYFQDGTVLWISSLDAQRAEDLSKLSGYDVVIILEQQVVGHADLPSRCSVEA
jgi:hypothetical protein